MHSPADIAEILNRRAEVEQFLFDCFAGKRPLPDKETCRSLAMKLGVANALRDPRFDAQLRTQRLEEDNNALSSN